MCGSATCFVGAERVRVCMFCWGSIVYVAAVLFSRLGIPNNTKLAAEIYSLSVKKKKTSRAPHLPPDNVISYIQLNPRSKHRHSSILIDPIVKPFMQKRYRCRQLSRFSTFCFLTAKWGSSVAAALQLVIRQSLIPFRSLFTLIDCMLTHSLENGYIASFVVNE